MTRPTPDQMRTLANNSDRLADIAFMPARLADQHQAAIAAGLRAAADQIEAVLDWTDAALVPDPDMNRAFNDGYECAARDLLDILTTNAVPKGSRDD